VAGEELTVIQDSDKGRAQRKRLVGEVDMVLVTVLMDVRREEVFSILTVRVIESVVRFYVSFLGVFWIKRNWVGIERR